MGNVVPSVSLFWYLNWKCEKEQTVLIKVDQKSTPPRVCSEIGGGGSGLSHWLCDGFILLHLWDHNAMVELF